MNARDLLQIIFHQQAMGRARGGMGISSAALSLHIQYLTRTWVNSAGTAGEESWTDQDLIIISSGQRTRTRLHENQAKMGNTLFRSHLIVYPLKGWAFLF